MLITTGATNSAQESAQRAALKQQAATFEQQQALADRNELRNVLDGAAVALDRAVTELDQTTRDWMQGGRVGFRAKLLALLGRTNEYTTRLSLRIDFESDVVQRYKAAAGLTNALGVLMHGSQPTKKAKSTRADWYQQLLQAQDTFGDLARKRLESP